MSEGTDRIYGDLPPFHRRITSIEKFGTVLTCMDGRPQRKVADYLTTSFGVRHLDLITTAGAVRHLAEETDETHRLLHNLALSTSNHGSRQIAVVAHHDCAGNRVADNRQKLQVSEAVARIRNIYPDAEVTGLWLGEQWIVERVVPT
ncbi:MAG TPA: carbonic anhydrase [Acidimicrobiia bacterium]